VHAWVFTHKKVANFDACESELLKGTCTKAWYPRVVETTEPSQEDSYTVHSMANGENWNFILVGFVRKEPSI
jgi:hypothetical protein